MKNTKYLKPDTCKCDSCYICTRRHKIYAWLALFGIFFCGLMTGYSLWGHKGAPKVAKPEHISHVNVVRKLVEKHQNPCKMREDALLQRVRISDNMDIWEHENNAKIYALLSKKACTENMQKYFDLADAESKVVAALRATEVNGANETDAKPCSVIENSLLQMIADNCGHNSQCHLDNARVYSKIAEDGCVENADMYKQRALNELQIADGVRIDEYDVNRDEMRSTVDTYKKLQMQNEARKYIKKVEKLVNPGVDFIMELQRVIEE